MAINKTTEIHSLAVFTLQVSLRFARLQHLNVQPEKFSAMESMKSFYSKRKKQKKMQNEVMIMIDLNVEQTSYKEGIDKVQLRALLVENPWPSHSTILNSKVQRP